MPKGATIRLFRAEVAGNLPPALEVGELAIDALSNPARLWTGVPLSRDPSGRINLLDTGAGGVVGDWWSPISSSVAGLTAGWDYGFAFRIGSTALGNMFMVNASSQAVSMGNLIHFTLSNGNVTVGNSLRVIGGATAPTGMGAGTGGTFWYNTGSSPGEMRYWNGQSWVTLGTPFAPPTLDNQFLQSSGTNPVWRTNIGVGIAPVTDAALRIVRSGSTAELARFGSKGLHIGLWGGALTWPPGPGNEYEEGLFIVGSEAMEATTDGPPRFWPRYTASTTGVLAHKNGVWCDNRAGVASFQIGVTHHAGYGSHLDIQDIGPDARALVAWYGSPPAGPGTATQPHPARGTGNFSCDMPFTWQTHNNWPLPNGIDWHVWYHAPHMWLRRSGLVLTTAKDVYTPGPEEPGGLLSLDDNLNDWVHIDVMNGNDGPNAFAGIALMNSQNISWMYHTSPNYAHTPAPITQYAGAFADSQMIQSQGANGINIIAQGPAPINTNLTQQIRFWCPGFPNRWDVPPVLILEQPIKNVRAGFYMPSPAEIWVDDWMGSMEVGGANVEGWVNFIGPTWRQNWGTWGAGPYYFTWNGSNGDMVWHTDAGLFCMFRRQDMGFFNFAGPVGGHWWWDLSDRRFKDAVEPERHGLDVVRQLHPIDFQHIPHIPDPNPLPQGRLLNGREHHRRWKVGNLPDEAWDDPPVKTNPPRRLPPRRQIGFSAQDVQAVLPDAVGVVGAELPDGSGGINSDTPTLGVNPTAIIAVCVNAIKELEQRLITLEQRNGNGRRRRTSN